MQKPAVVRGSEVEALGVLGVEVRFVCPGEMTGKAFSLMENLIPTGMGPPPHVHDWAEAYYVISGAVAFEIAGEPVLVEAGDFAYAPAGTIHGFKGASDEPARMLVFDAPAHAETFFRQVDRQVKGPEDFAKVPGIGARNGIHFQAPAAAPV
ncbi:MAG TPA: cupin domain-containing protein [Phenylobacterium sp.]|nr:cupin domain-containing protein [Phenylobacterium sp.]